MGKADYYKILGVSESATKQEISSAFKKLAKEHHPDKGGDLAKFQEISEAANILTNDSERQKYDAERNHSTVNPFGNHQTIYDIFNEFSFIWNSQAQTAYKKNSVDIPISLQEALTGCTRYIKINHNGKDLNIKCDIPAGIRHRNVINYNNVGDKEKVSIRATIFIAPHPNLEIVNEHLVVKDRIKISIFDLMLGEAISIPYLSEPIKIRLPKDVIQNKVRIKNLGFLNNFGRGDLIAELDIFVPPINTQQEKTIKRWSEKYLNSKGKK